MNNAFVSSPHLSSFQFGDFSEILASLAARKCSILTEYALIF